MTILLKLKAIPPRYSAIILGTLIAYIWSCLSWAVFPLHHWTYKEFKDSKTVARIIEANAPQSGVYAIPGCENHQDVAKGPLILAAVRLQGMSPGMGKEISLHLLTILIGTSLIVLLLEKTAGSLKRYRERVTFVVIIALAGAILNQIPLWNWHLFSSSFVFMDIVDQVVSYFLAGLAMAAIIKKPRQVR